MTDTSILTNEVIPDLSMLAFDQGKFRDLADTPFGIELWTFLKSPNNIVRMETAVFLDRAPVEALGPILVYAFGDSIRDDRAKQMIGLMVKQIMAALGYDVDRKSLRITRLNLFTSGAAYRVRDAAPREMKISSEQREAWVKNTATSPFNTWLDRQVKDKSGGLDLDRLYALAEKFGIFQRYDHLNPGQQRMNIGNRLRKKVPATEYGAA